MADGGQQVISAPPVTLQPGPSGLYKVILTQEARVSASGAFCLNQPPCVCTKPQKVPVRHHFCL